MITRMVRGNPEPLLTSPPAPANLLPSIQAWIEERFWIASPHETQFDWQRLRAVERHLGVHVPFDPSSEDAAMADVRARVEVSEDFAVRLLALLLASCSRQAAINLAAIFDAPGSKWEVRLVEDEQVIFLRQTGPVPAVVAGVADLSGPAHRHLVNAWKILDSPGETEPWVAYQEAVKAVEAVAGPIISPKNPKPVAGHNGPGDA